MGVFVSNAMLMHILITLNKNANQIYQIWSHVNIRWFNHQINFVIIALKIVFNVHTIVVFNVRKAIILMTKCNAYLIVEMEFLPRMNNVKWIIKIA